MSQSRLFAFCVLLTSASILGLAPILVRLTETGPVAAAFWRFLFALPLLFAITTMPRGEGVGRPSRWMLLAGVFFALDLSFWHYGIVMTSVANATVLCNLTPVVVTLFGWLVFRQRPAGLFVLALVFAMGGAFAMAAGADGHQGTNPRLGDIFSLSVSLWYSGYFLAVQRARTTAGAMRVTLWATLVGLVPLGIVSLTLGEDMMPATLAGWAACVGLGLVHVAGQGGIAWSLGKLPAAITALMILIQPVVAGLLSWWLFHETLTTIQAMGGALVLAAILLAQWSARRPSDTRPGDTPDTKTGAGPKEPTPAIS
jgi:drug/metabolite transporter (DMT)-like permease